jgi:vancomycin permeability regulator SanA
MKSIINIILGGLLILTTNSCSTSNEVTSYMEAYKKPPYEVVIIPASSYTNERYMFFSKVYWAKHIYDQKLAQKIMYTGGRINHNQFLEAENMAYYTEEVGVPGDDIIIETQSNYNLEEIYYGLKKCIDEGFERIVVASNKQECSYWKNIVKKYNLNIQVDYLPINYQFTNHAVIVPVDIPQGSISNNFNSQYKKEEINWKDLQISMINEDD